MKITIISLDFWGYGKEVAKHLSEIGNEVDYINSLEFHHHKNIYYKIKNYFSKTLLNKNLKKINRDNKVLESFLNKVKEPQDYIFIIDPGDYNDFLIENFRSQTKKLIGWNYDSIKRKKIPQHFFDIFDKLYSFDRLDANKIDNLHFLPNFIYLKKQENIPKNYKYKIYMILDYDMYRINLLNKIANSIEKKADNFLFQVKSKKLVGFHKNFEFFKESKSFDEVSQFINDSEILLDLKKEQKYEQTGLSFRIFDSLAFQKKIITNNQDIKNYDFYNPNNIFILESIDQIDIPDSFINNRYEPIPDDIYEKYTLNNWCKIIFNN